MDRKDSEDSIVRKLEEENLVGEEEMRYAQEFFTVKLSGVWPGTFTVLSFLNV